MEDDGAQPRGPVGLDATIIMHPAIWKASGHLDTFSDPMSTCRACAFDARRPSRDMLAENPTGQSLQALLDEGGGGGEDRGLVQRQGQGARAEPGVRA